MSALDIKLIIGLGNPGSQYENTKHNIAWMMLDQWPCLANASWNKKFKGEFTSVNWQGEKIVILKPLTYMNLSGESVISAMTFFKIEIHQILVIHDELDLNFGFLHFKSGGGLAGHNGLKSIAGQLGSDAFTRLRLGIGRPSRGSVSDWVLSPFYGDDVISLERYLSRSCLVLEYFLKHGMKKTENIFNKKNLLDLKGSGLWD